MRGDASGDGAASNRRITFDGGVRTLLGFAVAFAVLVVLAILIGTAVSDVTFPAWVGPVAGVGKFAVIAGIALALLRIEDVHPANLGLARGLLVPALVTATVVWVLLNLVVAVLATATGNQWGVAIVLDMPARWPDLPAALAISLLYDVLVVALVEEFVFRGYLQTKVVALLGDGTRTRIGLGILTASVVFGALHAPGAIAQGASVSGVLGTVALLTLSGIGFGVLYELTQNVYLVALLHAVGNTWPLVANVWSWSGVALAGTLASVVVVYVGAALAYRYWMADTDWTPVVRRTDATVAALLSGSDPDGLDGGRAE